jgi:hypothetical protein
MSQATTLSRAVATPAHIPEAAVYDFDMFQRAPLQQALSPKAMLALKVIGVDTLYLLWEV